jgi:hypothetical protein
MRTTRGEFCDSLINSSSETGAGLSSATIRVRSSGAGSAACAVSSSSVSGSRAGNSDPMIGCSTDNDIGGFGQPKIARIFRSRARNAAGFRFLFEASNAQ